MSSRLPASFLKRGLLRIQIGQAAALGTRRFVDDGVDERRLARGDRFGQGLRQFRNRGSDIREEDG